MTYGPIHGADLNLHIVYIYMRVQLNQGVIRCQIYHGKTDIKWVTVTKTGYKYIYVDDEKFYTSTGCQVQGFSGQGIVTIHSTPAGAATYLRNWQLDQAILPYINGRYSYIVQKLSMTTKIQILKELDLTVPCVDIYEIPQPSSTVNSHNSHVY